MRTTHHKYTIIKSLHARVTGHAHHLMDITCVALLILLSISLSSCRKELCYNHWEHSMSVKADVEATYMAEWEIDYGQHWEDSWDSGRFISEYDDHRPASPDGLRIVIYREDGYEERNIEAEGETVQLYEGGQSLLFYNNDTEYLVFDNMHSSATAVATTRTRTRFSLSGTESSTETRGYNPPDMLYGYYIDSWQGERKLEADRMPVEMSPLVYTYLIEFEFTDGLEYVEKARGELDGMATGVYLNSGTTSGESGVILFDTESCTVTDRGVLAEVKSFGIPGFPYEDYDGTRADGREYSLVLEVELRNGATKRFEPVDVSNQLEQNPRGGVILATGYEVTDEEGNAGGGGFDVDVDGWGDYEDIPLPIG